MIFLDTETVGFHGVAVLLQYAKDDGEIKLHHIWKEPISVTLELIEWIMSQEVCGFNLAFDHFRVAFLFFYGVYGAFYYSFSCKNCKNC